MLKTITTADGYELAICKKNFPIKDGQMVLAFYQSPIEKNIKEHDIASFTYVLLKKKNLLGTEAYEVIEKNGSYPTLSNDRHIVDTNVIHIDCYRFFFVKLICKECFH